MKKTCLKAPYQFERIESPIPEISDEQVLLAIRQIGICASDMQMYHGLHKYMTFPVVFGHEAAATVCKVGKNVKGFCEGDNVTVEPQVFCGECEPCRSGFYNVCEHLKVMGVHMDGFACDYYAIKPMYLHHAYDLNDDYTALIEPLAVGIGSARRGNVKNKTVCVVGAGTIGNLVAQSAKALGAEAVLVTDIKDNKLDYAKQCGIDYAVNTLDKALNDVITDTFGARKADVIIDCAATPGSILSVLQAARPRSVIVITGNFKVPVEIEIPLIQRQEIDILGHMMYRRIDFEEAIQAARDGRIHLKDFVTQHYSMGSVAEAFRFIDENSDNVMKVMLRN